MNLLDGLKSILGSLVNFEKFDLSFFSNNKSKKTEYHLHLDGTFNGPVNINNGKVTINPNKLPAPEQEKIKAFIRNEAFIDCDYILTDKDSSVKELEEEIIGKEISKFKPLEGVIPHDDFYALKAATVVNELYNQGKSIEEFKSNIFNTYGERGRKICIIYSAGYFNEILEAYLKDSQDPAFNKEEFIQRYNVMVTESAFSIFVHALMSKEVTIKAAIDKLSTNKRYGIQYVNIHAIGKHNIKTAEQAVNDILSENKLIEDVQHSKSGGTLYIKLSAVPQLG